MAEGPESSGSEGASETDEFDEDQKEFGMCEDIIETAHRYPQQGQAPSGTNPGIALSEENVLRSVWNILIAFLLIYISTVFPYILCFWHFGVPQPVTLSQGWVLLEQIIDILFYIDLLIQFVFTYKDKHGHEVYSLKMIAIHYLRGFFLINLIACVPPEAVRYIIHAVSPQSSVQSAPINQGLRISRLQRMSRLARLVRLTRVAKLFHFLKENPLWQSVQTFRGVRVANFGCCLCCMVHLLACGWYLVASLHSKEDLKETWLGRRTTRTSTGATLLDAPPSSQWLHAVYFVFTVFTTVGFGDMAAVTNPEIVYVVFVMLTGAVFHSIIVSEMISVVTSVDQQHQNVTEQLSLLDQFGNHTELQPYVKDEISKWVNNSSQGMARHKYDRERVKSLITSSAPRKLLNLLPQELFSGLLWDNDLIQCGLRNGRRKLPPRFPIYVALSVNKRPFEQGELVYCAGDYAFNVFLVISGIFAHVAIPGVHGGDDGLTEGALDVAMALQSGAKRKSRGNRTSSRLLAQSSQLSAKKQQSEPLPQPKRRQALFPYQIFSREKYFGENELLHRTLRRSTVRCEQDGYLLVLHRSEFFSIMDEFPTIGEIWKADARRHEIHRCLCLKHHTRKMTIQHLAAWQIQRKVREKICHTTYHRQVEGHVVTPQANKMTGSKSISGSFRHALAHPSSMLHSTAGRLRHSSSQEPTCNHKDAISHLSKNSMRDDGPDAPETAKLGKYEKLQADQDQPGLLYDDPSNCSDIIESADAVEGQVENV